MPQHIPYPNALLTLTMGVLSLCRLSASYWKRALSLIHSSFTASFRRGVMRITSTPRESTYTKQQEVGQIFWWGDVYLSLIHI